LGLNCGPCGADFIAEFVNAGGVLVCSRLAPGGVVAAAGVEEAEESEAFHGTQGLVEGGDAQGIEFDGGFALRDAHADNYLSSDELQGPGGFDCRCGKGLALAEAVGDFFSDDGAEFAVGINFHFGVADAAEIEVGAIADATLVFIRPLDQAVVAVLGFQKLCCVNSSITEEIVDFSHLERFFKFAHDI
jgi:hypothetical protein